MELTWKVGERRRGDILSYRGNDNVCETDVTFTVVERHPTHSDYDWRVKDEDGTVWGACEEWGAVLVSNEGDSPRVGQMRRTKIRHIHGDREVTVRITQVYDGYKAPDLWGFGQCMDCDQKHHIDGHAWSLSAPSVLVTNLQPQVQEPKKQPDQKETSMNIEERKNWALEHSWDNHVPKEDLPAASRIKTVAGAIYVVGYSSDFRGVVLATSETQCMVLAGNLSGYTRGQNRNFGASALAEKAALLVDADSTEVPLAWKKGELRHGPLRASLDPASALLVQATYTVLRRHSGSYDWEVEVASGSRKGEVFSASEKWESSVVPEALRPLYLCAYEPDPDGPRERPRSFKKGDVYMARKPYSDTVKAGDLLQVSRDSADFYFIGAKMETKEKVYGGSIYEERAMHLQLMRPVGSKSKVVAEQDQCGDRSTSYGLTCSMRKDHGGDEHRRGDATWAVAPKVIKLGNCANSHTDPLTGVAAMAVAEVIVSNSGRKYQLCAPCIVKRDEDAAAKMRAHDAEHPQPRHQPRYQVDSMTLDAGGVFRTGG